MRIVFIAIAAAALSGCVTAAAEDPARSLQSISYETGPCFGACPTYKVTVHADGRGVFEGRRFTTEGAQPFQLSPTEFRDFAARLKPLRPASGAVRYDSSRCERVATDMPSVDVEWTETGGAAQQLHFYFGCDMEKNRAIAERLRTAPEALPIAHLIRGPAPGSTGR
jgi:hypothetical protein